MTELAGEILEIEAEFIGADAGVVGEWRYQAACLDTVEFDDNGRESKNVFYGVGTKNKEIGEREAKQICRGCDVRQQCLEWALDTDQKHGVWGGTTEDERRDLISKGRRAVSAYLKTV